MKVLLVVLCLVLTICAFHNTKQISKTSPHLVIAYTIYAESRGEGQHGMCLVASVIYNRSVEKSISAKAVCLKSKQFSCWNGITSSPPMSLKADADRKAWEYAKVLARDILNGKFKPFCNSNMYFNYSICNPTWAKYMTDTFIYKNHKFGTL